MKFMLLCFVLFCAAVKAQQDLPFPDYWENDYDNFYDYSAGSTELKETDTSQQDETVIQEAKDEPETQNEGKEFDVMQDYQIEDNRLISDEKESVEDNKDVIQEPLLDDAPKNENSEDLAVLPLEQTQQNEEFKKNSEEDASEKNKEEKETSVNDGIWSDVFEDDVDPLPIPSTVANKDILDETRKILSEDTQNFDDQPAKEDKKVIEGEPEEQSDIDQIIEETNKLLEEADDAFEPDDYDNSDEQEQETSEEDLFSENGEEVEEDTPQKVYADLNADLDKLFETLNKLSDDNPESDEAADSNADDDENVANVQDYEEKYSKPYREDVVMSWRDIEADADDADADSDDADESNEAVEQDAFEADDNNDESDEDSNEQNDYENIDDSNLSKIFANNAANTNEGSNKDEGEQENTIADKNDIKTPEENASNVEKEDDIENAMEKDLDYANYNDLVDTEPNADDDLDSVIKQIFSDDIKKPQPYGDDALIDETQPKNEDAQEFESIEDIKANDTEVEQNIETQTVMVDDLSSAELDDLMSQFAIAHSEDLDINSKNFAKHVAPIHVTLSVDEPTVITSPNYPNPYPTGNIVDWIFEGPGTGIELNITNFAVNGAMGDYLLVKPGGLDESGPDGLIFSYRLNSERRYRFTDVNRMFVRFEAKPGWAILTGFSFSVRMIWPLPELADDIPEPEAVINRPTETLTLNLAGLTLPQFLEKKSDFIELIADMAEAYIRDNNIDRGLNTTYEVTQITRTTVCNIHWPNYETCVEVTFGVPLHYNEETEPRLNSDDLDNMWTGYIGKEQFAERLKSLGITEYAIPNDRTVLIVWLVIAAGVVISMGMLAIALWRFSCFEDYTRMRSWSDADSLKNEKRNLDLYPTPHQSLPPLFTENDYKWVDDKYDDSTRVDLGGFANKSYVRDELFDFDSDEDVMTTRDRKGVISPRDIYEV